MSFNYMQPFVTLAGGLQTQHPAGATEFNSMYESFNPLTTVNKQHFVEWFSGSALDSIWNTANDVGTPTYTMDDTVDGGLKISVSSELNATASIGWGTTYNTAGKRQYAHNGSVYIDVFKQNTARSTIAQCPHGFSENQRGDSAGNNASLFFTATSTTDFFQTRTINGAGSQTDTATTTAYDTNWHVFKVENKASSVEFTLDGTLEATSTTNLPAAKVHPIAGLQGTSGGSPSCSIRYMECYNT